MKIYGRAREMCVVCEEIKYKNVKITTRIFNGGEKESRGGHKA